MNTEIRECNICGRELELNVTNFLHHPTCIGGFMRRCRRCHYANKSTKTGHRDMVEVCRREIIRLEKINIELTNRIEGLEHIVARLNYKIRRLKDEVYEYKDRPNSWKQIICPASSNEAEVYIAKLVNGIIVNGPFDILTPNKQRIEVKSGRNGGIRLQSERPYDWLVIVRRNNLFLLSKKDVLELGQENVGRALTKLNPFKTTPEQLLERINK